MYDIIFKYIVNKLKHIIVAYGRGLTPISKVEVNRLTYIIAGIQ